MLQDKLLFYLCDCFAILFVFNACVYVCSVCVCVCTVYLVYLVCEYVVYFNFFFEKIFNVDKANLVIMLLRTIIFYKGEKKGVS